MGWHVVERHRIILWQSSESETGNDVGCTRKNLGDDGHAEVQRDASIKITEVLIFGEIVEEAVSESHSDEWRCYGNSVEESSFSWFHIHDLDHKQGKDDEDNNEDGCEKCNCGLAFWVQNEWVCGFAGLDPAIDTKTHPGKTEDAYALENKPGYWARNEVVSVLHVRFDSALFKREKHTL